MSAIVAPAGSRAGAPLAEPVAAVGDSLSVAVWTVVSRASGVVRGAAVAAVLGATYFANTYQFTNSLPNLVFYGFLAGSLFTSLLVPALVGHLDTGDLAAAGRVAGGLLGIVLVATVPLVPLAVLVAPAALRLGAGADPQAAAEQVRAGGLLLLLLMPQVPLYALVGTATAVMNAQRRFALAAAAPALENLGILAVLAAVVAVHPRTFELESPPGGLLLLLGLGTTGAVALHAAAQWWGARRVGVTLRPRRGWRDPEVRALVARAVPALAQAGLSALLLLVLLVVANRTAGGVVALQLAMSFFFLPVALAATPVALSLAPRLSRLAAPADGDLFRDTYLRGTGFALFLVVPAATAYVVLAGPLAAALSFGAFAEGDGVLLVAAALTGLGVGVAGEAVFLVTTYACYARGDTRTPLRAMAVQAGVGIVLSLPALALRGPAVLAVLGAALSTATGCSALLLRRSLLRRSLPAPADGRSARGGRARPDRPSAGAGSLPRTVLASLVMVVPAWAVATGGVPGLPGVPGGPVARVLAAAATGAVVYGVVQWLLRAPELGWAAAAVGLRLPAPPVAGTLVRDGGLLLACAAYGALVAAAPVTALLALAVLGLAAAVAWRPVLGAYLLIALTPLTAGIDRGRLLPVLRPSEALALLVVAALAARGLLIARTGGLRLPRLRPVELSLVALCVCSSVLPVLVMTARGRAVSGDDVSHALVLWKLAALYVVVRVAVGNPRQVRRCLLLSVGAGALVCGVAILQSLELLGVPALLAALYSPFGVESALSLGRGSSTLSLPAAVADLAILNLAVALALLVRGDRRRALLGGAAVLSVLGVMATGQFSSALGLLVALAALVAVTGRARLLAYALPAAALGAVLLQPVLATRLRGFQSASGLPESWVGRLRNLQTYFWPELSSHGNWLTGVRPSARVASTTEVYGWIWIESGYTWLLWGGGIALLAAYVAFVATAVRAGYRTASAPGVVGAAAAAVVAVLAAQVVLMLFDPHLTYRGAGDALFLLLALAGGDAAPAGPPETEAEAWRP